jgi:hypothetical protein
VKRVNEKGLTFLEIVIAVAMTAIVLLMISQMGVPMMRFFQRMRVHQQATMEARTCLDTLQRVLADGRASTLLVTNTQTTPMMPSGRADFKTSDGSAYTLTWSTAPTNTVHMQRRLTASAPINDTILATHVTELAFTFDPRDPSLVYITLQIRIALDSSGAPGSFLMISLRDQAVRMVAT